MKQTETNEIKVISKKLDEACFIDFGTRVVQKKDGGAIFPVYGGGGATFKMDSYNRENCLVVSRFAMSKQCTRFVEGKFYLNDSGLTVRPKNEKELSQEYLDYLLLTLNDIIYSLSRGTAQRNLNVTKFRNLEIKYPDSIELQLHFANLLSQAEHLIVQRKESIRLLDEFLKSKFLEIFGDPVKNEKGWAVCNLSDLGSLDRGVSKARPRNLPELLGGIYPLIQTGDVTNAGIYITKYKQTYSELGLKQSKLWPKGTMLITIAANIAQTSILSFDACFPDSVVGFVTNTKKARVLYVHFLFKFFQALLESKASQTAQKNINLDILRNLKVPCPPIELQSQFTKIVEKTESLKTQYQQSLQELENLYGSLSQKAFKGELMK